MKKVTAAVIGLALVTLRIAVPTGAAPPAGSLPTLAGDVPLVGDWDGDGVATVGVRRGGQFFLRNANSAGGADLAPVFGEGGDLPLVGDWDGNGTDTIGVWRRGVFFLRNANSTGPADIVASFGDADDVPLVGDWDGNGTDTIGVWRRGVFYLRDSNTSGAGANAFAFGDPSDVPVVGDWDGDGTDTVGVRRGGTFLQRNSNTSGPADTAVALGNAEDAVVVGSFDGARTERGGLRRGADFLLPTSHGIVSVAFGNPTVAGNAFEAEVLDLTNAQRRANGCGNLHVDARLALAARGHSVDMAVRNYFEHTDPDGHTPWWRAQQAGYSSGGMAENIAAGYASPAAVVNGWMASPGHRANILNCSFTDIGVGFAQRAGSQWNQYWTQLFGVS